MHKQNNQENHFPDLNIFQGQEINEKYIIGNSIGSGQQSMVFELNSLQKDSSCLTQDKIIKLSTEVEEHKKEAKILKKLKKAQKIILGKSQGVDGPIPSTVARGVMRYNSELNGEPVDVSFIIMKKYECNLLQYVNAHENSLKLKQIASIIQQILLGLEIIHQSGYIHNDLKLENLMLQKRDRDGPRVLIIDYGFTTEYLDQNANHIPKDELEYFRGNLMFASLSALNFDRPSRKDDLISVCYLALFLINGCELPCFKSYFDSIVQGSDDKIKKMRDFKKAHSLLQMAE